MVLKPTDKSNYPHFSSAHPLHCKLAIPYGQFQRISRICTKDEDFARNCEDKAKHFARKGYPVKTIRDAYEKCLRKRQHEPQVGNRVRERNEVEEHKLFMITKYRPSYNVMEETIKNNWPLIQKSKATRKLYDYEIKKVNRKAKSVKDYLVKSRLDYHPETEEQGEKSMERRALCKKGCRVCPILNRNGKMKSKSQPPLLQGFLNHPQHHFVERVPERTISFGKVPFLRPIHPWFFSLPWRNTSMPSRKNISFLGSYSLRG